MLEFRGPVQEGVRMSDWLFKGKRVDGDVNIESDKSGNTVKVSGGQFSSKMPTLPREDFPSLPDAGGGVKVRPSFRY